MMTDYERAVLNWRLRNISPEAWLANAEAEMGSAGALAAMRSKVAKYAPDYERAVSRFGGDFKHGRAREIEERQKFGEKIPDYLTGD